MPSQQAEYTVQRFREGFAIVWREDGKRRRRQLASKDRQSAEAEARSLWEGADSSPWTVGRCMTAYLSTITEKPSYGRRQDAWKAMKLFWDAVDPAMIDEPMCRKYRSTRRVGDATARYELMQLSTALGWAADQKHLPNRPKVWLPSTPERKERHLTHSEFNRFLAAVKADHARLYVHIGVFTTARPSAILELTWDRVDFARRRIDFTPPGHRRTNKRRTIVPVSDQLLVELQKGFAARTSEYVIEHGGQPIKCIKKAFQAASERSGVHVTPYMLRHTGAVWAAENGTPMPELAQFMGHDDSRTTERHYARFSPDYLMGVANAIKIRA